MAENCIREQADAKQISRCRTELEIKASDIRSAVEILRLAGSDVRLKILYLLSLERELCPCDLSDILDLSISAVSQHLRKLKDGHLVLNRKDAQTIFYRLHPRYENTLPLFLRAIGDEASLPGAC